MNYHGDFPTGQDIVIFFSTNDSDGAAIDPSIGSISIYKDGADSGVDVDGDEITENIDGLTGIHCIKLDVSDHPTLYTAGSDFDLAMTAVIDSTTVRTSVGSFSIQNRYMVGTNSAATEAKQDIIDTVVDAIKAVTDNLPENGALTVIDGLLDDIKKIAECDHKVDDSDDSQWVKIYLQKGTDTEIMRKNIQDLDGNPVAASGVVIGRLIHTASP